jgi:hypothetical protein
MLRLSAGQGESLFDLGLPVEVRELPADLAALDGLLSDPALFAPHRSRAGRRRDQAARARDVRWSDWPGAPRVQDRSRAVGRRLRRLNRTLAARTGHGKATALRLTGEAGRLVERSVRGAWPSTCAAAPAGAARGPSSPPTGWSRWPDGRPIRNGKLRTPTEFGYAFQLAEVCENARRGARGLIIPAASQPGSPNEPDLLPATAAELQRLGLRPREVALDGGFFPAGVAEDLPDPQRVFIAGRQSAGSRRTDRRLAEFRVGWRGPHQPPQTPLRPQTITPQATTVPAHGRPGRSSPTTSTPSPSEPPDSIPTASGPSTRSRFATTVAPPKRGRVRLSALPVYPGQVARRRRARGSSPAAADCRGDPTRAPGGHSHAMRHRTARSCRPCAQAGRGGCAAREQSRYRC